jgi:regulator of protease activity HflC (stomatin/prohibitin superfamily)
MSALDDIKLHEQEDIIVQDDSVVTDHLEHATILDDLIVKADICHGDNVITEIMNIVNTDGLSCSKSMFGTTVVDPGQFKLLRYNGRIEIAGPGRWKNLNPRSVWGETVSISTSFFKCESLTIVRVPKGYYGLATYSGKPQILGEGLHVKNDRLFNFDKVIDMNSEIISNGTINILRIPQGKYGIVVEDNIPKVLKSGCYAIDSNYFKYEKSVDINTPYIQHQTIHIIRVTKSQVCCLMYNNKPIIRYEGNYIYNTPLLKMTGLFNITDDLIKHGTITRLRVKNGEIALAWHNSKPKFIEKPDLYEIDDPTFIFVRCEPASTKDIALGSRRRLIVCDGEVGISYVKGRLDILAPSTHEFDTNDRIFDGIMSIKQQDIQLVEEGKKDTDFLCCDTKDFVEIGIKAAVYFRISDPRLAILNIGNEKKIKNMIKETSIATMQGIMRSSALNQVAQSKVIDTKAEEEQKEKISTPFEGPKFFDKVHDEFIFKLHDNFKNNFGIEISNIRIESFKIVNQKLASSISDQAMITAQTETQLANLASQREIAVTKQEQEAKLTKIKAEAEALKLNTETQARNNAIMQDAQTRVESIQLLASAEAKAFTIKTESESTARAGAILRTAKAEADALKLKAEAEAKAIELKANAEMIRNKNLDVNEIGKELARLTIQSETVTKSMQGVEKMIYLPSNANMGNFPLQMFGLNGGFPLVDSKKPDVKVNVDSEAGQEHDL